MTLHLHHRLHDHVEVAADGRALFRYHYAGRDPREESPKPYLHPVRTLGGELVTNYRPHDHVWHKGIAMTMAHLSGHNFWGGPTYVHGRDYVALDNNGSIRHLRWRELSCDGAVAVLAEDLGWVTAHGRQVLGEERTIRAGGVDVAGSSWVLSFETVLRNDAGEPLVFGSPTTEGRPSAGYGGLFWRGSRDLAEGSVLAEGGMEGPEVMGRRAAWLAYRGRHDGSGGWSTLLFVDDEENLRFPTPWFVRTVPFAAVSFAFSFHEEYVLEPGAQLRQRYRIVVGDGCWDRGRIAEVLAEGLAAPSGLGR